MTRRLCSHVLTRLGPTKRRRPRMCRNYAVYGTDRCWQHARLGTAVMARCGAVNVDADGRPV